MLRKSNVMIGAKVSIRRRLRWWHFPAGIAVAVILAYIVNFAPGSGGLLSRSTEDWARFGEYVGGMFGVFAFAGVLITVDLQRKQLKQLSQQAEVDELYGLARELAANIDRALDRPVHVHQFMLAELSARSLDQTMKNVLQLVTDAVEKDLTDSATSREFYLNSINQSADIAAPELHLLRNCLMDSEIRGGSPVIPAYYKDRYGETVRRMEMCGYTVKYSDYWLGGRANADRS
jgi:hypothetical protein